MPLYRVGVWSPSGGHWAIPSQLFSDWAVPKCPSFFGSLLRSHPSSKGLNLAEKPSPLFRLVLKFCLCVLFFYRSQLTGRKSKARFKRRATAVPNSVDRIRFDFSTAVARRLKPSVLLPCSTASLAVLHGISSIWFQTSCYRRAELNS